MCSIKSSTQKHVKNSTPFFPVYAMLVNCFFLIHRMGQEYNEDYVRIRHRNDFSNKLFSAWDYHITNKNVAQFKHKAMKKHFEVYS